MREGIWTPEIAERAGLASQLKGEIEDASPLEDASLFSDLLNAALSEVDWHEIAEAFLEAEDHQAEKDDADAFHHEAFYQLRLEKELNPGEPLFELGRTVITPEALATVKTEEIQKALWLHHRGDWGFVEREDWLANDMALEEDGRLLSVARTKGGIKFWVITEADRSSTCVLLPGDY